MDTSNANRKTDVDGIGRHCPVREGNDVRAAEGSSRPVKAAGNTRDEKLIADAIRQEVVRLAGERMELFSSYELF
jgi:hypothetical protein